ncbi:hypothetical protein ACRAWG_27515 [Methylobacterium sp. P31]
MSIIAGVLGICVMLLPGVLLSGEFVRGDAVTRICIGILLGLSIIVVSGVILGSVGLLSASGWICMLALLIAAAYSVVRRRTPISMFADKARWHLGSDGAWRCLACIVALLIGFGAYFRAVGEESGNVEFPVIEMWVLDQSYKNLMTVGLRNRESSDVELSVEAEMDGKFLFEWTTFKLRPGEALVRERVLPNSVGNSKIIARLFRGRDRGKVINEASLFIPSSSH